MKYLIATLLLLFSMNPISSQTQKKSAKVTVNGKKLYYEVYGEGPPLLFLHGYSLSSKHWHPYVEDFAQNNELYLIDLTGHGQSDPFKEDLSIKGVAEDLYGLIQELGLEEIRAIGFSFGGDVLFQLALAQPKLISSMITIGAVGTWTVNDFPQYQEGFTFENRANFPWLATAHQSDAQVKGIMDQFINYTVEITTNELQKIETDVLLVLGDDDEGMDLTEVARVKKNLPNADLWVLPNVAHSAHEGETKEEFVRQAKSFFARRAKVDDQN